jgi:phosphatidylserine/phosphatidylglycerophosphate/cardiolipin synthase-like enzyme
MARRRNWSGSLFLLAAILAAAAYIGPVLGQFPDGLGANSQDGITCYFSPSGGCTEAVVAELQRAERSILVQAYSFTSTPIAKALAEARERGVDITVILDKSQRTEQYSAADFVLHAGIKTYIDDKHAIAHNKIMLIDGRTILTGSFNFTKAAETSNAENLLVIRDKPTLYAAYEDNFRRHLAHSPAYEGREGNAEAPTASRRSRKR